MLPSISKIASEMYCMVLSKILQFTQLRGNKAKKIKLTVSMLPEEEKISYPSGWKKLFFLSFQCVSEAEARVYSNAVVLLDDQSDLVN